LLVLSQRRAYNSDLPSEEQEKIWARTKRFNLSFEDHPGHPNLKRRCFFIDSLGHHRITSHIGFQLDDLESNGSDNEEIGSNENSNR
jgi:hypothetical protein